jgi:hypothetical protein
MVTFSLYTGLVRENGHKGNENKMKRASAETHQRGEFSWGSAEAHEQGEDDG